MGIYIHCEDEIESINEAIARIVSEYYYLLKKNFKNRIIYVLRYSSFNGSFM